LESPVDAAPFFWAARRRLKAEQLSGNGKKFAEAVSNNDAAALAALYSEDAVFVTDRGPVYGRDAIAKMAAEI